MLPFFTFDLPLSSVFALPSLFFFVLSIALLALSKWLFDRFTPYHLDDELLEKDNKALAFNFSGFVLGLCIVIASVLGDEYAGSVVVSTSPLIQSAFEMVLWSIIGMVLMGLSIVINDRFLLFSFSNREAMLRQENKAVSFAVFASFIGSALIIRSLVVGQPFFENPLSELLLIACYFIFAKALLVGFSRVFSALNGYSLQEQVAKDNPAAGITYGIHLVAMALIISEIMLSTYSLVVIALYFLNGLVLLSITRLLFDKLLFHKAKISKEIVEDRNYGIAFIEGTVTLGIALIIVNSI